jgi:hypothetical protein
MARDEALPFPYGRTYMNGETIDTNNLPGPNLLGKEYLIEDNYFGTGRYIKLRVVRNLAAAALLPKRLVSLKSGSNGTAVDGYTTTTSALGYPVDHKLPAAGVPVNDLFYIVVDGPTIVKNDIASGASTVLAAGDPLAALTAVTSGSTTAGRVAKADFTGATAPLANAILGVLGRAISAVTTANTNNDVLVDINKYI